MRKLRNIKKRACDHPRLTELFSGPVKPVHRCDLCGKIFVGDPKEDDEK